MDSQIRLRLWHLFAVLSIVSVLLALVPVILQNDGFQSRRMAAESLQKIVRIINVQQGSTGSSFENGDELQPGGAKSWRLLLFSAVPSLDLPNRSASWQSAEYAGFDDSFGRLFCFYDQVLPPRSKRFTKVMAITGPGTAHELLLRNSQIKLDHIEPDAILLSEVVNAKTHWMQRGDLELGRFPESINPKSELGIGGNYEGGFHVVFADGTVWFLRRNTPFELLKTFFTIEGAEANDRDAILRPYMIDELVGNLSKTGVLR